MIKIQAIELYYGKSNFSMTLLIWLVAKMHFSKNPSKVHSLFTKKTPTLFHLYFGYPSLYIYKSVYKKTVAYFKLLPFM